MEYEKKYETKIMGQAIGEEISKVLKNNNRHDYGKKYREIDEYIYKTLLYFINISAIISYIAGAMVMQLPFIDKFGIMPYDFKLYLLIGTIIFVIVQVSVLVSSIFEEFVAILSYAFSDFIEDKLNLKGGQFFTWVGRIVFIPIASFLLNTARKWVNTSLAEDYSGILMIMLIFIEVYVILSLICQNKRYGGSMNTTNFVLIIVALTTSLYIGRFTFEGYLLTDAKLINNQHEKSIELLLIDNKSIYYKENNTYKYETLKEDTVIEFLKPTRWL